MKKDISINGSFDNQFNNIKALLVFLVVLGHFTELFKDFHPIFRITSVIIYSFHMPLFVFITGYFSKNVQRSRDNAISVLVTYVLYEVGMSVLSGNIMVNLFQPQTVAWYLLSTFFWRMLLKDITRIKFCLPFSIALGLYVGFFDNIGTFLSLSRSIVFLPFFLLGFYFTSENKKKVNSLNYALTLILFIGISAIVAIIYPDLSLFFGSESYSLLGYSNLEGFLWRLLSYVISFIMCILFIRLVNDKQWFFSRFGRYTMQIFLLHSSVKLTVKYFIIHFEKLNPYLVYVIMFILSVVCMYIFGNKFVGDIYNYVIDTTRKIFIKEKANDNVENA